MPVSAKDVTFYPDSYRSLFPPATPPRSPRQPNLAFRYCDGGYVTSRAVMRGEELFISYDRDYYPGYTARFRARESLGAIDTGNDKIDAPRMRGC